MPKISEYVSKEILRVIKKRKLPISVVFTPVKKLRDFYAHPVLAIKPDVPSEAVESVLI